MHTHYFVAMSGQNITWHVAHYYHMLYNDAYVSKGVQSIAAHQSIDKQKTGVTWIRSPAIILAV